MSCCLRVLCYRNRTQAADGRLLSLVPGLEPPIGICSTRPSDTIKSRLLSNLVAKDVHCRRSVHFHVVDASASLLWTIVRD